MTPIRKHSQGWVVIVMVMVCLLLLGSTLFVQAQTIPPSPTPTDAPEEATATAEEFTAISTPADTAAEPTATDIPTETPIAPTATLTITPTLTLTVTATLLSTEESTTETPIPTATELPTETPIAPTATPTATRFILPLPTPTATPAPTPEQFDDLSDPLEMAGMSAMDGNLESFGALVVTTQNVTFPVTQLTGDSATIQGTTTAWVAEDPTALGEGWHLTVSATDFVDGSYTIPKEGLALRLLEADIGIISGNAKPTVVSPFTDFTAIGTTQIFVSASAGEGMGSYSLQPAFQLSLPAETYAGTYHSTLTVTIIAGPGS